MDWPTVSILVLNYNGKQHLDDCFSSLLALDYPADRVELLLIDNASSDDSVMFMRERFPIVRVVQNEGNLGFCAGNNRGAEAARGEYIVFLNNDMRVHPAWLRELIAPCLSDPAVTATAAKILDWDGESIDFANAAMNFMGWGCQPGYGSRALGDFDQAKDVLFACGGSMLVKRRAFLDAGGFDEDLFAYFEDTDLGWRLWLMGHAIRFAPRAVVYHRHHGYWGAVSNARKLVLYERNALISLIKNYDDDTLARALPASLLLAIQRAYLDVRPDPSVFGLDPSTPSGQAFGSGYYLDQAWQLIRRGAFRELMKRALDEIERRQGPRLPAPQAVRAVARPIDGRFEVPAAMIGRLLAGRDVLKAWPVLMSKRQAIQAKRWRSDAEVLPLFRWGLISNVDDDQFILAMRHATARFGLIDVFSEKGRPTSLDRRTIDVSLDASRALLAVMDRALALTGADESRFRLNGSPPDDVVRVPVASVGVLAEVNRMLWSLPEAPLVEMLRRVADGCQRILNSDSFLIR